MIPKKSNTLYKEVAEELNMPTQVIEDFIEFYYKEIRRNLTELLHPRLNVECLGQFVIRPKAVKNAIPRLKAVLANHDTSTFNAYHNKVAIEKKINSLENMEKELIKADLKKQKILDKKAKYINDMSKK
jgi:4-alpha-glucanotransferase